MLETSMNFKWSREELMDIFREVYSQPVLAYPSVAARWLKRNASPVEVVDFALLFGMQYRAEFGQFPGEDLVDISPTVH